MPAWGLQTCSRQQVGVQDERRDGGLCRCINQTECNLNRHISAYTSVWQRCRLTGGAGGGVACGGQHLHVLDQNTGGRLQMWKSSGGVGSVCVCVGGSFSATCVHLSPRGRKLSKGEDESVIW